MVDDMGQQRLPLAWSGAKCEEGRRETDTAVWSVGLNVNLETGGCFLLGPGVCQNDKGGTTGNVSRKAEGISRPTWKALKGISMVPVALQRKQAMQTGRPEFWDDQVTSSQGLGQILGGMD